MFRVIIKAIVNFFCSILFRVKVIGIDNIQKDRAYIICANHTSNWDPVILYMKTNRKLYMMAKEELFKNGFIKWFAKKMCVFPIKRGKMDIEAMKYSLKILKSKDILGIFPEGTRNGMQKNGKAQNGTAYLALKTGVEIIPVGIKGSFKPFTKVELKYGEPLDFKEYKTNKPEKELLDKVSKEIMDNIIMLTK